MDKLYLSLLSLILFACEKQEDMSNQNDDLLKKGKIFSAYIETEGLDCSLSPIDLIAGQNTVVGHVYIETDVDDECLNITYNLDVPDEGEWYLSEIHLDVVGDPNDFPINKGGNPQIGLFEYKYEFDINDEITEFTIPDCIPIPEDGDGIYIAAHGVACQQDQIIGYYDTPNFEEFCASLPETVDLYLEDGGLGYFTSTISDGGWLDGTYPGWCILRGVGIPRGEILDDYTVICSLDPDLADYGLVDYPENMPKVNYILNQNHIGNYLGSEAGAYGTITINDVQAAIWTLIDEAGPVDYEYDADRLQWILNDVAANAAGFEIGCGGVVAVIIAPPEGVNYQISLIPVPITCEYYDWGCETIWADGFDFPGNNWAMYFKYCAD